MLRDAGDLAKRCYVCYTQAYRTVPYYSLQPQSHVRKMAAKCHCDVCLKEFDYKYRYERHV